MRENQKNPFTLLIFGAALSGGMYKVGLGDPIYFVFFLIGIVMVIAGIFGLIK